MYDSSPVDIILDMVVGSIPEQNKENIRSVITNDALINDIIPVIGNFNKDLVKLNTAKSTTSSFSFKLGKIFGFKKRKNMKNGLTDFAAITTSESVEYRLYNSLKKNIPKFKCYFSDTKIAKELFDLDGNVNELNNISDSNKQKNNEETNNEKVKIHCKDGLELFFNYVVRTTDEFTEEEILEMEMRILKIIKRIKGKRDLKQHLRRYAASMNFKENLFNNNY